MNYYDYGGNIVNILNYTNDALCRNFDLFDSGNISKKTMLQQEERILKITINALCCRSKDIKDILHKM